MPSLDEVTSPCFGAVHEESRYQPTASHKHLDYTGVAMATFALSTAIQPRSPQGGFANEPFVNSKAPENARAMQAALDQVAAQLGREYDLVIGGHRLKTGGKIHSLNPARPSQ